MKSERNIMNGRRFAMAMRTLLVASAILLAGCATPSDDTDVVATFYPLAWATQQIANANVTVGTLVPEGVEPHDWEPTPSDIGRLGNARLVVTQGAGFEPWLDGLLANLGPDAPRVVDTTANASLVDADPHTWLDPLRFAQQARAIAEALVRAFPEHVASFRAREADLVANLRALDADLREGLAACETRVIIANHDAYGYLARRYAFEVVAISGLSPEVEPSPEDVARAVDAAREYNVSIIFFEELVSPRVADVVAREVGAQTRVLSPLESKPDEGDYFTRMEANLANLREAMRCT